MSLGRRSATGRHALASRSGGEIAVFETFLAESAALTGIITGQDIGRKNTIGQALFAPLRAIITTFTGRSHPCATAYSAGPAAGNASP